MDSTFHVRAILHHSKHVLRLDAASNDGSNGENFNLFHLLGIGHLEVSTHSRILKDLLDPHGQHGQGAVFLDRFVRRLGLRPFDFKNAKITQEVGIGTVTDKSGGRLDLVISDGNKKRILIENKIHAVEQINWVSRYINHAPGAILVFLTLDGREPENLSPGTRPANLTCASYKAHITDWLRECRNEAANAPLVRESITQYLNLILDLTQQNRGSHMNEELVKTAVENRDSLAAYYALRNAEREVQAEVLRYLEEKVQHTAEQLGFVFHGSPNPDYSIKGSGFEFRSAELETIPLRIRFEFDRSGYRDFAFGFVDDGKLPTNKREQLQSLFARAYETPKSSPTWPAWVYWDKYQDWSTGAVFVEILFGNFIADVESEVRRLAGIARGISVARV